ncbi:MAG: ABC transporter permease [Lachnospiraceae bacterium]|nr:ABC transporter permease [Lachnospiraceae bacterium]
MNLFGLARSNFKRSVREYGMLVFTLAFSIFIFFNFQNMIYSDAMKVLENFNKDYIDMIIHAASVVFVIFLFFFVWYASNVFLNQRKKEIGIYIFMGLDNSRIGKMYALESCMIGFLALFSGLFLGVAFSKLFQMVLLRLSEISVDVKFSFSVKPVAITGMMFLAIYGIMTWKGYHTLKTSSVLDLLSGAKQKEMKPEKKLVTALRIGAGTGILLAGYGAAWNTGGARSLENALLAVVLVIVGVYLLYSGLIPAILRSLTRNKRYLYRRERNLWVNSLAFRIKKNYRTYAMVTVLMICSVTVMAVSIAMKQRYEKAMHFDQTYNYQIISSHSWNGEEIARGIEQENEVEYWNEIPLLMMDPELFHTVYTDYMYGVVPCSQVEKAAEAAGLPFPYADLADDEIVKLEHEILMSFVDTDHSGEIRMIGEETYKLRGTDTTPYLGKIQTYSDIYIVSDGAYERLRPLGVENRLYNYRIQDMENMEASRPYLETLAENSEDGTNYTGINFTESEGKDDSWIRVMYSLCLFMFVTLVLASGSIIFLKVGNDAYEDRQRYQVLGKLGISKSVLGKSVRNEICFTYYCPFFLMAVTSYFSVRALGNVMKENLFCVNLWSMGVILVLFAGVCGLSVRAAKRRLL